MAENVRIRINDREFRMKLAAFAQRVGVKALLRICGTYMIGSIDRTFRDQGVPPGSWPPLAESTLRGLKGMRSARHTAKSARRGLQSVLGRAAKNAGILAGKKILIRSGRLKNSIHQDVQGNRVLIGTNLRYAAIHQFGGKAGRGRKVRIPARPYVVFRPEDPERMRDACEVFVDEQAGKEGLK